MFSLLANSRSVYRRERKSGVRVVGATWVFGDQLVEVWRELIQGHLALLEENVVLITEEHL